MRQKLFACGDDYVIQNEEGQEAFLVDAKAFSIGKSLSFQDMGGTELAVIRQKLLAWGPTYELYRDGDLYATIKKKLFTFFNCRFMVDVPGPRDLEAEGGLADHEYVFRRMQPGGAKREVARVSKAWFSVSDTYGVTVDAKEDDVLILASTVVIDLACEQDHD